jgi:hypothetical protein
LKEPELTKEESAHIENCSRVFLVEELPEPLWRIISISKKGNTTLCKPEIPISAEGYSDLEYAKNLAYGIAHLSEDNPIVRICVPRQHD